MKRLNASFFSYTQHHFRPNLGAVHLFIPALRSKLFPAGMALLLGLPIGSFSGGQRWLGLPFSKPRVEPLAVPEVRAGDTLIKRHLDVTLPGHDVTLSLGLPVLGGRYLGRFIGIRCFNCPGGLTYLMLQDTVQHTLQEVALRNEQYNSIPRPIKHRQVYEYQSRCIYFDTPTRDTLYLGGWMAITVTSTACYPRFNLASETPIPKSESHLSAKGAPEKEGSNSETKDSLGSLSQAEAP